MSDTILLRIQPILLFKTSLENKYRAGLQSARIQVKGHRTGLGLISLTRSLELDIKPNNVMKPSGFLFCFVGIALAAFCWLIISEFQIKHMTNREYVRELYGIDLSSEVNTKENVSLRNEHTVICVLPAKTIQDLLSKRMSGYSEWRKVPPEESYGNSDIVVDGYTEKGLFEAHRVTGKLHQQMFINIFTRKTILINT